MDTKEQILIGLEGLKVHRLRSTLTMLGIIFGVAAVIAMLSVGEGAKREALQKYKFLGVNNIIVRDKDLSEKELEEVRAKFSRGLSLKDAEAIGKIVPTVDHVACQAELKIEARFEDKSAKVTLVGVTSPFQELLNYEPRFGTFLTEEHHKKALPSCVLGAETAKILFPVEDPLGQKVKLDDQWFEVVGTMGAKSLFTETIGELAARDLNQDIYIPLASFLMRFTNILIMFIFSVFKINPAFVQTKKVLTLDEAIDIALENSFSTKSLGLRLDRAGYGLNAAKGRFKTNAELRMDVPNFRERVQEIREPNQLPVFNTLGQLDFRVH